MKTFKEFTEGVDFKKAMELSNKMDSEKEKSQFYAVTIPKHMDKNHQDYDRDDSHPAVRKTIADYGVRQHDEPKTYAEAEAHISTSLKNRRKVKRDVGSGYRDTARTAKAYRIEEPKHFSKLRNDMKKHLGQP